MEKRCMLARSITLGRDTLPFVLCERTINQTTIFFVIGHRTYTLSARSVIMIMDDQDAVPEFPAGHTVLALYPSTTCFYKAMVVQSPSKVP